MKIGVPKESGRDELRVALIPEVVRSLTEKGLDVVVQSKAGEGSGHPDSEYKEAGASIGSAWDADIVVKVGVPTTAEIKKLKKGQVLIGHLAPLTSAETNKALAAGNVTAFAMESIPRITRAQAMDALSSQANVAGYAAALLAAREAGRFFPMMTTAAGTVAPAKVLVLGAGVAGLQAIATAKRLGAVVTGFDIRRAAWEQIASLGGRPLELDFIPDAEAEGGYARPLTEEENEKVREALAENAAKQDVIITTAQIPGRPAPILLTKQAVANMSPGSVIVDLAGDSGGNCELTKAGQTVVSSNGVKVISPTNLPSDMAAHASQLYAKNIENLLGLLIDEDGELTLNFDDEIIDAACIAHEGAIRGERTAGYGEPLTARKTAAKRSSSAKRAGSTKAPAKKATAKKAPAKKAAAKKPAAKKPAAKKATTRKAAPKKGKS